MAYTKQKAPTPHNNDGIMIVNALDESNILF